jgi:hypothetical protein
MRVHRVKNDHAVGVLHDPNTCARDPLRNDRPFTTQLDHDRRLLAGREHEKQSNDHEREAGGNRRSETDAHASENACAGFPPRAIAALLS